MKWWRNVRLGSSEKKTDVNGTWKKKNGLIQRERPAGRESPQQVDSHIHHMSNRHDDARTGSDRQQEVMAREWTVNHLQDEMRYIKEVRDSLEKVRERMYGQFGGMQQSMQKLSQEIRTANSQRRSLESEVRVRTEAMESFDQMNSSLISANLGLQKSLLENCQSRVDRRDEVKSLRSTCEKTQEKLRETEKELAAAHAENQTLRLQVETSREASTVALQELSAKLQQEYDEKLREEQRKHREEIENLQAQLDEYIRRLEEAERNIKTAEAKIAERDQRIMELERLLDCMSKEKGQLQKKLQECEQRLRLLELTDTTDGTVAKRSKELQSESVELRERIKHLNDMVFCQQRKVKGMIEEVQTLRAQVAQKDMFISELLDRIAIVECENNELEDKLKYFMSTQNKPRVVLETREIGVGCDLTFKSSNPPPSRLDCSLLRYTPVQYSRFLQSSPAVYTRPFEYESPESPVQSGRDEVDAETNTGPKSSPEESMSSLYSSQPRSRAPQVYSPFMKLMEITAKINID
uniref:Myocardial zonula adherens protein n=1 Tax=Sparus aurata TaxID=8175 RepID=A0A671YMV9_SPAAU